MNSKSELLETKKQEKNVPTLFRSDHEGITQSYIDDVLSLEELAEWNHRKKYCKSKKPQPLAQAMEPRST